MAQPVSTHLAVADAQPRVLVIIVVHNHAAMLEACLATLPSALKGCDAEVIVADTGSHDRSRAVTLDHGYRWLDGRNRGFGAANNRAWCAATRSCDWIVCLNPDTELDDATMAHAIDIAESRQADLLGIRQVDGDGQLVLSWFAFPSLRSSWGSLTGHDTARSPADGVDWVMGSFMLIRSHAFEAVGGFDEDFFLFFEEVDLCRRLNASGYSIAYTPDITMTHHRPHEHRPRWREVLRCQARNRYCRKWFNPIERLACRASWSLTYLQHLLGLAGDFRDQALATSRMLATWGLLRPIGPADVDELSQLAPGPRLSGRSKDESGQAA